MTYKTILVHCNDNRRIARVLAPAVELAERLGAHLVGLSVTPPVLIVPTGMPGTPDTLVVDERCQAYRRDNAALKAAFEAAADGRGFTCEWREAEAGSATVPDVVTRHARAVDLIVAAQADPQWPGSVLLDAADRLAVEAGRPVLIVPNEGVHSGVGSRVVLAWNGAREGTRAAFDALPLMQQAEDVKVLTVDGEAEDVASAGFVASDICAALARHGVASEALEVRSDGNVGRTLLARAIEHRADLLVMGCYGHSRLSELVFGGATRHVLKHMTIPVLMSH